MSGKQRSLQYALHQERQGKKLRRLRGQAGLTTRAVAIEAGVSASSTITGVEHGGGSDAMRRRIFDAITRLATGPDTGGRSPDGSTP